MSKANNAQAELVGRLRAEFLPAILHGDDEHRAWLTNAVEAFIAGIPIPACKGSGRKDAEIERMAGEVASTWRNGITNTVMMIDFVRKAHPVGSRNKAYAEFDAALNDMIEKWFSFSRGVSPASYEEAEAEWKRFRALGGGE